MDRMIARFAPEIHRTEFAMACLSLSCQMTGRSSRRYSIRSDLQAHKTQQGTLAHKSLFESREQQSRRNPTKSIHSHLAATLPPESICLPFGSVKEYGK
jgi:hypothetical protein